MTSAYLTTASAVKSPRITSNGRPVRDMAAGLARLSKATHAYRYRLAQLGELAQYRLVIAQNAALLASQRLGCATPAVNPMVQAGANESCIIGFNNPCYGWCRFGDSEIFVNFTDCTTDRLAIMAAGHETYHLATDYRHTRAERYDICSLFARGLADSLGFTY